MADLIRAGIIGLDTSHVVAFTKMFHDEKADGHVPGVRVVAAYPSFSPDLESSASRVDQYTKTLAEQWDVNITGSIPEMLEQVDAVLIESVDGRRHLPELRAVADAGKPVFIDKPFSASLADAKEMVQIIRDRKLPCWSSSALRYDANIERFLAEREQYGNVQGCDAFSPAALEPTNPGFFWYGIHGVEILYTIMGRGCRTVRCSSTPAGDMAVGIWEDGRLGSMRGIRAGRSEFGAVVLCEKAIKPISRAADTPIYGGLIREIARFFQTGRPPVPIEDTLEICAFIDAALRSSQEKCADVELSLPAPQPAQ